MTDVPKSPDWLDHSRHRLNEIRLAPQAEATGRVLKIADGIAQVTGLDEAALGSLLKTRSGKYGFAHALGPEAIAVVMLDEADAVEAGETVTDTGEVLHVPVGDALLGRVVDPLGRPLDGRPTPDTVETLPIERPAPSIIDRALVSVPVETGVLVVDSLFALGRGQRELIVGDRSTGKTALATDIIVNQKSSDLICIYVAVGQRTSSVERVIEAVRANGAPERCVFVVGGSSAPPGLQWIAPFAAMSMAEYFRDRGQHALIVIDDLTQHAATHRELALLTREPPGREAYPGDIFYLHARLLERAAKLSPEKGGGSLTALPIAETDAGNLSAYIPTNLISITDGQIVLNTHLFAENQRPAVDVGLSVSRVGGKAQKRALRDVSGRLRLEYAQFQELEMFTRFGGLTNPHIQSQIKRGNRIRALLRQQRYTGLRLVDQVSLLASATEGILDDLATQDIPSLRERLAGWLDSNAAEAVAEVQSTGTLDADVRRSLVSAVASLVLTLKPSEQGG